MASIDPATTGSISGTVQFKLPPPVMPTIDMSSNPQCERQHSKPAKAETVVVNANGTLRNVYVHIAKGLPKVQWPVPNQSAKLNQEGCVYTPHVLGLMRGQQLEILNSDPVNHNVHAEAKVNDAWNESEPPRAEHKYKVFSQEEILFPVTCSVHPWMRALLAVSANPFFSVTGDEGGFTLTAVPAGKYTIEAVHEKYGTLRTEAEVKPGAVTKVEFAYGS